MLVGLFCFLVCLHVVLIMSENRNLYPEVRVTQRSSSWRIENLESGSSGSDGDESFHNCNEALDRNIKSMDRGSSGNLHVLR